MKRKQRTVLIGATLLIVIVGGVWLFRSNPETQIVSTLRDFETVQEGNWASDRWFPRSSVRTANYRNDGVTLQEQIAFARRELRPPEWQEKAIVEKGGGAAFIRYSRSPVEAVAMRVPSTRMLRRYLPSRTWMIRLYPKDGGVGADLYRSVDR